MLRTGLDDDCCGHDPRYKLTLYLPKGEGGCIACAYLHIKQVVVDLKRELEGCALNQDRQKTTIVKLEKLLLKARTKK
jgi:hypothetical protein